MAGRSKGQALVPKLIELQDGNSLEARAESTKPREFSPTKTSGQTSTVASKPHPGRQIPEQQTLLGVGMGYRGATSRIGVLVDPFAPQQNSERKQFQTHRKLASLSDSLQEVIWSQRNQRSGSTPVDYVRVLGMEDSIQDDGSHVSRVDNSSAITSNTFTQNKTMGDRFQVRINPPKKMVARDNLSKSWGLP